VGGGAGDLLLSTSMQVEPRSGDTEPVALTIAFSMRDSGPVRQLVLRLDGELDSDSARTLEQRLRNLPEADVVVLELRGLGFIDSSGLRLLVDAKRRAGDRLRLVGAQPPVSHVFESAGDAELLDDGV
jgi:anti-sigma B factor antagonist